MGKWKEKKLNEVVSFSGGSQPPKSTFSKKKKDGFIRLIQIRDYKSENHIVYVEKTKAKKFCSVDDVMIGRYGPPVFQILKGLEGAYNVALMKAIPNEEVLSKGFLFKFLENPSIQAYIVGLSQRSAGQSGVNKKALEDYPILIPTLPEQERIVAKLDGLFEKIDQAIRLLEENIAHTEALMGSVLDEEFGRLKLDFENLALDQVLKIKSGGFLSSKKMSNTNEYNVYGGNGINGTHNVFNLEGENIVIGRVGAKCGNVRLVNGTIWVTDNAFYVSEIKKDISKEFLLETLRLLNLGETANQAAQPVISFKGIRDLTMPIPDKENQKSFCLKSQTLREKTNSIIETQTQKLNHLKALKSSLLDRAFKGEL